MNENNVARLCPTVKQLAAKHLSLIRKPISCKLQKSVGEHLTDHFLAPRENRGKVMGQVSARLVHIVGNWI